MEQQFYNEDFDFEELIREKSDQVKMYPSDKVWKGIHRTLHGYRSWYRWSLLFVVAGLSYLSFFQESEHTIIAKSPAANKDELSSPKSTTSTNEFGLNKKIASHSKDLKNLENHPSTSYAATNTKGKIIQMPFRNLETDLISELKWEKVATAVEPLVEKINTNVTGEETSLNNSSALVTQQEKDWNGDGIEQESISTSSKKNATELDLNQSDDLALMNTRDDQSLADHEKINWLQENAVYNLPVASKKKMSWQFAVSPTMNYRKLVGNDNARLPSEVRIVPLALTVEGGLKNLVKHNPAVGFEASSMMVFAINSSFRFKSGFQFNYSKYNIQAYNSSAPDRATIALGSSAWGGVSPNAITTYSSIGNFGGNSETALKNEYYQISMPFGVEWAFIGKRRLQMGIGTTLQPTYLLNRDSYLITTDYKNYTKQPSLVSRWNLNAGVEAFLSYETSGYKIQLGPQFRYQLFSTYTNKYPIHEYLMEYGIRLAFSKTVH